jgi:hypothetical protein
VFVSIIKQDFFNHYCPGIADFKFIDLLVALLWLLVLVTGSPVPVGFVHTPLQ